MPRQNTRLESEGAEFLVLGHMLVEGLPSYKMYVNMPGYDLIAVNPDNGGRVARVSVKSRWSVKASGSIIRNFDSDFVVFVKLNRGGPTLKAPEFYVIPTATVKTVPSDGKWGKVRFSRIPGFDTYREAWHLIREFLALPMAAPDDIDDDTEASLEVVAG